MSDARRIALAEYREKLASGEIEPSERKTLAEKHEENPTRKTAIDLFCFQCMGGDCASNIRRDIKTCPATQCPLHKFRPYQ